MAKKQLPILKREDFPKGDPRLGTYGKYGCSLKVFLDKYSLDDKTTMLVKFILDNDIKRMAYGQGVKNSLQYKGGNHFYSYLRDNLQLYKKVKYLLFQNAVDSLRDPLNNYLPRLRPEDFSVTSGTYWCSLEELFTSKFFSVEELALMVSEYIMYRGLISWSKKDSKSLYRDWNALYHITKKLPKVYLKAKELSGLQCYTGVANLKWTEEKQTTAIINIFENQGYAGLNVSNVSKKHSGLTSLYTKKGKNYYEEIAKILSNHFKDSSITPHFVEGKIKEYSKGESRAARLLKYIIKQIFIKSKKYKVHTEFNIGRKRVDIVIEDLYSEKHWAIEIQGEQHYRKSSSRYRKGEDSKLRKAWLRKYKTRVIEIPVEGFCIKRALRAVKSVIGFTLPSRLNRKIRKWEQEVFIEKTKLEDEIKVQIRRGLPLKEVAKRIGMKYCTLWKKIKIKEINLPKSLRAKLKKAGQKSHKRKIKESWANKRKKSKSC